MSQSQSEGAKIRARAARAVCAVTETNRTIDWVLQERSQWLETPLARELVFGTLRHFYAIEPLIKAHLKKPLKAKDQDIYALLLVGAYQLYFLSLPDFAAINETVAATKPLKKTWAKGLANAILRNVAQTPKTERSLESATAPWLEAKLRLQYPQSHHRIVQGSLSKATMWLRVNQAKVSVDQYQNELNVADLKWHQPFPDILPETIKLLEPVPAATLPGWQKGWVAVQDVGAQLATACLSSTRPRAILDSCCAPGGKLFHLLEQPFMHPPGKVECRIDALDVSEKRLDHTKSEAIRLGHERVSWHHVDATSPEVRKLADVTGYDLIVLDAPCTGTGTLRRHPDLHLVLQPEAVAEMQQLQSNLLRNLWPHLQPGGRLLYSTCSLLSEENNGVTDAFVKDTSDANVVPLQLPMGKPTATGWLMTPEEDCDGFFYCLLQKTKEATHAENA